VPYRAINLVYFRVFDAKMKGMALQKLRETAPPRIAVHGLDSDPPLGRVSQPCSFNSTLAKAPVDFLKLLATIC
jgi:hypothetical protein